MPRRPGLAPTPPHPTPGGTSEPAPPSDSPLPSERDEATGSTGGIPDSKVQQAHRDVKRGLQDTDRSKAADEAYQKQKT